jgi:predicted HicB family RNase H-like nuclease
VSKDQQNLMVWLTKSQHRAVKEAAAARGQSMSDWVRVGLSVALSTQANEEENQAVPR